MPLGGLARVAFSLVAEDALLADYVATALELVVDGGSPGAPQPPTVALIALGSPDDAIVALRQLAWLIRAFQRVDGSYVD